LVYSALHKPRNIISAAYSQDNRKTVRELVDAPGHFYSVGRLDVDGEGLILLTYDGDLTNRLTHPRYMHDPSQKVLASYKVRVASQRRFSKHLHN
jgi:pseudouridine synthase